MRRLPIWAVLIVFALPLATHADERKAWIEWGQVRLKVNALEYIAVGQDAAWAFASGGKESFRLASGREAIDQLEKLLRPYNWIAVDGTGALPVRAFVNASAIVAVTYTEREGRPEAVIKTVSGFEGRVSTEADLDRLKKLME